MDDIRWIQRFENVQRALQALQRGVELNQSRELSELEQQGIQNLVGSRDATRQAFRNGLITDGETWMEMIRARNQTSHTYNLDLAQAIVADVTQRFFPAFAAMQQRFQRLRDQGAP